MANKTSEFNCPVCKHTEKYEEIEEVIKDTQDKIFYVAICDNCKCVYLNKVEYVEEEK